MATKTPVRNASERFVDAVKAGIEKLALELNVPLAKAMGLTKAYFLERNTVQAKVTKEAFEAAYAEIVAMNKAQNEEKRVEASESGRLPLSDKAQEFWDLKSGSPWFRMFSIMDVRDRFAAEIKAGEQITPEMLDTLKAEKMAERELQAKLVDARKDGPELECGSPAHPDNAPKAFQPMARFRIEWFLMPDGGRSWRHKCHAQGEANKPIEYGNFLVVGDKQVPYCDNCRQRAWDKADEATPRLRITFYSLAGAKRKLDATAKSAQKDAALGEQLQAAASRTGGSRHQGGPRPNKMDRLNFRVRGGGN